MKKLLLIILTVCALGCAKKDGVYIVITDEYPGNPYIRYEIVVEKWASGGIDYRKTLNCSSKEIIKTVTRLLGTDFTHKNWRKEVAEMCKKKGVTLTIDY